MNKRALVWMLIALSLMAALSACILVPVGATTTTAATITTAAAITTSTTSRSFHQKHYVLSHAEVDLFPAEDSR